MGITQETRRESHRKTDKSKMHGHVMRVLQSCELPLTAREIAVQLCKEHVIPYPERSVIQPRITELVADGKVKAVGKVYDSVTERRVAAYELVKNI